ncbi:MAG: 2-phospho-L-lactate guanylyltransferase, partial [Actinomycetota bacterium]
MNVAGILPVKSPAAAKGRLAGDLHPAAHAAVVEALLLDALDLCLATSELRWWVVSDDDSVLIDAKERGLETLRDSGHGLNAAVGEALDRAEREGATAAIIIPSDVPLARPEDIRDLLDTGATSDVVVVPSGADGGTNGLFLQPADLLEPSFGPSSLQAHLDAAEEARVRCSVLPLPRL